MRSSARNSARRPARKTGDNRPAIGAPESNAPIEQHLPDLKRRARVLLKKRSEAEDLAQDCMLRALPHLDDIENLRAYLFQTLRNAYVDRLTVISREAAVVTLDDAEDQIAAGASPLTRLEVRDVARLLAKLPVEQQQVVLLVGAAGATYEEAAKRLQIPIGTVMSRLSRARNSLRDLLASGNEPAI
jgi:RNA polymerase sigma-70 factor (ECF subfamily)